jgi:hypothetical protein
VLLNQEQHINKVQEINKMQEQDDNLQKEYDSFTDMRKSNKNNHRK